MYVCVRARVNDDACVRVRARVNDDACVRVRVNDNTCVCVRVRVYTGAYSVVVVLFTLEGHIVN